MSLMFMVVAWVLTCFRQLRKLIVFMIIDLIRMIESPYYLILIFRNLPYRISLYSNFLNLITHY